ncbi:MULTISPECIES: hypothetical protein [Carnobacterium]|jgi:hypothetical protein|uniref:Uncharacterized protein n=3 Tax=Carnobacterium maltaromaticum TaxID=2751 RepID=K8E6M2_CARML|nr:MULTISPECIES: hypothetical protein [Carnobacterium]AOA03020.1 hypothetical protein BFC23_11130 [Carnobacterium maltaromaticum]KRN60887.1 hypothetical protein IV70_GL000668 [Carnobacterium maltaromaticum DSM 20342]MBC9789684.1 hypothetical protein [Carnobacterium maltaromaticum]MBC9810210.1 hypothetical protein [Carnobacterium maltaromaticum]MBQ6485201.1 hypothetical protein [Carnobacterium sp.]
MLIEEHWNDGLEYYIEFEATTGMIVRKVIIVPATFEIEQVKAMVVQRFTRVKKIICIEEVNEVLLMNDYFDMKNGSNQIIF